MKYSSLNEERFRASVSKALERIQIILDSTRHPRVAEEEDHKYDDKYALAEFVTNTSIAAQMNALERLGLDSTKFKRVVQEWAHGPDKKSVTMRFRAEDACSFLKENEVELSRSGDFETTTTKTTTGSTSSGFLGMGSGSSTTETTRHKVVTKIKEYHWKVDVSYSIVVFPGTEIDKAIELQTRSSSTIIVVSAGQVSYGAAATAPKPIPPIAEKTVHPSIDVNLTWFFQRIEPKELICQFAIERNSIKTHKKCRTPRRNEDVKGAVHFNKTLYEWTKITHDFFVKRIERDILDKHTPAKPAPEAPEHYPPGSIATLVGLSKEPSFNGKKVRIIEYITEKDRYQVEPVQAKIGLPATLLIKPQSLQLDKAAIAQGRQLSTVSDDGIFCPIVPLMEQGSILSMGDVGEFLTEQTRSLDEAMDNLARMYPPRQLVKLVSVAEASIVLICMHLQRLTLQYHDGVDYLEHMLKQQLIQAIGKEVSSKDFDQFISFHHQKMFGRAYAPLPFTYALRRPNCFPEGTLTIESTRQRNEPVETWARRISGGNEIPSILIPINASTSVELRGDRVLHGWMQHRFQSSSKVAYQLAARARQFSSFVLVIGTMMGPDKFHPKGAIILQNKDEVLIPLLCNVLPSAKEFKDAISSLSPEQQAFAKSFRSMQLESSVFAVFVIQIKPQLEVLLGLPSGALTKEIQLTQDLMSLFVEYQIPSDLLSFDGDIDASRLVKVDAVKGYVKAVMEAIRGETDKQLAQAEQKSDMKIFNSDISHIPYLGPANNPFGGNQRLWEVQQSCRMYRLSQIEGSGQNTALEGLFETMADFDCDSVTMAAREMSQAAAIKPVDPLLGQASERSNASRQKKTSRRIEARTNAEDGMLDAYSSLSGSKRKANEGNQPVSNDVLQPDHAFDVDTAKVSPSLAQDFTLIPKILDAKLEIYDTDNSLRSTILKAGSNWCRKRQENLLIPMQTSTLGSDDIEAERKKAFDLLDAISRSGTLPIDCSELHVVVALSHCFENDVMGTVIQDNINPIEKVEKSSLMLASAIYGSAADALVEGVDDQERLMLAFPMLFEAKESNEGNIETYQD